MVQNKWKGEVPDNLGRLFEWVQQKRTLLFEQAQGKRARRRHLQLALGLIGAFSGLAAAAVFTDLLGGTFIKVVIAVATFLSGCITALMTSYYSTSETDKMFEGASQFLGLREKIDYAREHVTADEQRKAALKKLKDEYVELSDRYDRYFPPGSWSTAVSEGLVRKRRH